MLTNSAKFLQSSFGFVDFLDPILCLVVSCLEGLFEWCKPWVEGHNAWGNQLRAILWDIEAYLCHHWESLSQLHRS